MVALGSTIREEPYPAWVDAGPNGGAFVRVPNHLFQRLVHDEPAFRDFVLNALSNRVFELMGSLEEIGSAQMEQRVARLLLRKVEADGVVRASQTSMAADLATAREVVFRALRSFAARGLVHTGRMRVRITDHAGLEAVGRAKPGSDLTA